MPWLPAAQRLAIRMDGRMQDSPFLCKNIDADEIHSMTAKRVDQHRLALKKGSPCSTLSVSSVLATNSQRWPNPQKYLCSQTFVSLLDHIMNFSTRG